MEVVTVIETLSPSNKRRGGDGRREYLAKRDGVLSSHSHLVELDLLCGGERLPVIEPLPSADYFCIVSRAQERSRAALNAWSLRESLPTISIPLKCGDDDVLLPLQHVFETVHGRAGYDLSIDYLRSLEPSPSPEVTAWITKLIACAA